MSTTPPHDPYETGDQPDRSSGSTPPPYGSGTGSTPPPYSGSGSSALGSTPAYGSDSGSGGYGATPPPYGSDTGSGGYGSTPPAYGSTPPAYGAPPYGGAPAYAGAEYGQGAYGYAYPKNGLAIWSLVLGLVGLLAGCGFFAGIPAIIVGGRAKRAVAEGQANNPGMATAGVVLGWVATILSILGIIGVIALFATGVYTSETSVGF